MASLLGSMNITEQNHEASERIRSRLDSDAAAVITMCVTFALGAVARRVVPFKSPPALRAFGARARAPFLPFFYISKKRASAAARMEAQLPDALDFLARSMRAGHAFTISLEMVGEEIHDPLGQEFRALFNEQNLGASLERSFGSFRETCADPRCAVFLSAVLLQRQTGGNLSEILNRLSHIIRERFRLKGQVKAVSAHGRLTATILTLLPLATLGGLLHVPWLSGPHDHRSDRARKSLPPASWRRFWEISLFGRLSGSRYERDESMMPILLASFLFLLLMAVISLYGYRAYVRPSRIYDRVGAWRSRPRGRKRSPSNRGMWWSRVFEQIGEQIPLSPGEQTVTKRDLVMAGFRSDGAIRIFYRHQGHFLRRDVRLSR